MISHFCISTFSSLFIFSYKQEFPSRFKKDIIISATGRTSFVEPDGLQRVLINISAAQAFSAQEIESEVGNENGQIPAHTMMQLLQIISNLLFKVFLRPLATKEAINQTSCMECAGAEIFSS